MIKGIGGTKSATAYKCLDGLIINIGCFNDYRGGHFKEIKEAINNKYTNKKHPYFAMLRLIKSWYDFIK